MITFLVGQDRVLMNYGKKQGEIGKEEINIEVQDKSIEDWRSRFYVI